MRYKRFMIILVFAVFLLSITCVSASEIDDTLASEDTHTIGLSVDNDIIEDNLQTSEENDELASTDYDEAIAQTDTEVLGADSATYSDLANEISQSGNIKLTHKNYTYTGGETITIGEANKVIDGNGAVIDMNGSTIRAFHVNASGVTIKNLTIKNANYNGRDGGAIYFSSSATSGTVTNCNFTNNTAYVRGGAIYFENSGNVTNCNFTDNIASIGGAVYFWNVGEVTNCNFTGNTATYSGGAVYFYDEGSVSNCNFTGSTATYSGGGAIYFLDQGTVTNCNFADNKATGTNSWGGAIMFVSTGEVSNCNFTGNTANRGGAVYLSSTGTVTNCNFTGNTANRGGAVYLSSTGTVTNCNFTGNNATTGSAIYFYKYHSSDTLTVSNSTFLNNRANAEALDVVNNITITFTGQNNLLNAIYSPDEVTFNNVTYWGAKGITTVSATMSGSNKAAGQNITVKGVVNGKIIDKINVTDENGEIVLDDAGDYWIIVSHKGDLYYTEIAETLFTNMKLYANVTSLTTNNKTVNITAKSNIFSEVMPGKLLFILPNGTQINATYGTNGTWWAVHKFDAYGDYQVNATYVGLDNVTITNATISISKTPTTITVENTTVELMVLDSVGTGAALTPADAGELTFTSSNTTVAKVEDGKIIAVGEGSAIITVSFSGNDDYAAAEDKTINVDVIKYDSKV
ncbi:right-handed parallel beta-helix repeat-containing protein, partial [uncultured Methanobrevibacter sp.]|uniref:right-handed parallel beta-helix repeat-containing protein n=1 Tax=uncultured Methanobrevibacter sp. TaxID=253161 RepID=UPI002590E1CD